MNRTYTANSPYSLTPTERIRSYQDDPGHGPGHPYEPGPGHPYEPAPGYLYDGDYAGLEEPEDFEDFDDFVAHYDEQRIDRRWMWIAGIAGVILFIAVGTTGIILGGGDSGSVSATGDSAATTSAAPATTSARPSAGAPAPVAPSLPPETVTTVTPTAEAAPPTVEAAPPAPPAAVPPPAPAAPRSITYRVTGNRPLVDLVTIVYTDGRGALQTDVNVALPWTKTVVLEPGVELKSVTATSVASALNCSITDAAGNLITAQNTNAIIASCIQ